jgi:hypothetical protein
LLLEGSNNAYCCRPQIHQQKIRGDKSELQLSELRRSHFERRIQLVDAPNNLRLERRGQVR